MLRINHVSCGVQLYGSIVDSAAFCAALRDLGVWLEPGLSKPDYTLIGYQPFVTYPQQFLTRGPVLLFGSYDMGTPPTTVREHLDRPEIVRLLQGANYVNYATHMLDWRDNCRHGVYVNSSGDLYQPPAISQSACDKIRIWAGFGAFAATQPGFTIPPLDPARRAVQLHAVLTTTYTGTMVARHRHDAVLAVQRYMEQAGSSVVFGCNGPTAHSMTKPAYCQTMRQCSVVLSPWGWGEYCIRDFEALLCGCVLIKPDTAFSQTWPHINPGEHYIVCRPDFADLPERMEQALQWAGDFPRRQQVQTHVQQAGDIQLLAQRFKDCLTGL